MTEDGVMPQKKWTLEGFDTFEGEFYPILGEHDTEQEALDAARVKLAEFERDQPSSSSGGQGPGGIQDRVYIVHPDGPKYRFSGWLT
jgi:hypothetical protein